MYKKSFVMSVTKLLSLYRKLRFNKLNSLFPLLLDRTVPHLHMNSSKAEELKSSPQKTTMLALAVTHHNLPESIAVGVVYADWLSGTVEPVLFAVSYTVTMALG
ncbi:MAG: hypothetical protein K2O91_00230 [Lachnospiraceae bacterium]|nr:hypothetical protein [Lachnospiraceae bacterium]